MSIYGALCDTPQLIRAASQFLRETAARRAARDASPASAGNSTLAVTTTDGSYPTGSAQVLFAMLPQELDAADTEGATSSASSDPDQKFYALNLGTSIPPQGTQVVCHAVGGRWTFRYD
jgi:hypothetical protein